MEKFEVKSQNLTSQYEFENDDLKVNGGYASNKAETEVQSINGTAYRKGTGEYVGNFTGTMAGEGEMEYSLSKMSRTNANKVWDAIDAIEGNVIPSSSSSSEQEGGEE